MFNSNTDEVIYLSRSDTDNPLASYTLNTFELDGEQWPSVEHYYQGCKFEDKALRDQIINADTAHLAYKIARKNSKSARKDWKKIRKTIMTRGLYIMFKTYPAAAEKLLSTKEIKLIENSQYDYYWGCGRDLRGDNIYGHVLMGIRSKLREP